nr:hypothetical protein [Nannocystis sp.]
MKPHRCLLVTLLGSELLACAPKSSASDSASESGTMGTTSDGVSTTGTPTPTTTMSPATTDLGSTGTATDGDPTFGSTAGPDPTTSTTTTTTGTETTSTTTTAACDMVSATAATSVTGTGGTTDGQCMDEPGLPNDSACTDASGCGCASGKCFIVPALGGFCGECLGDEDCGGGGCTVPNVIGAVGSRCNKGGPGDGCMSDAVCQDPSAPLCKPVIEVPGIITVATCGACRSNADCPDPALHNCSPDYDLAGFTGQYSCKADGSVANNLGCNLGDCLGEPLGDRVCASGSCGEANIMGLVKLGVCGECDGPGDCQAGRSCADPVVDLQSSELFGSFCQ